MEVLTWKWQREIAGWAQLWKHINPWIFIIFSKFLLEMLDMELAIHKKLFQASTINIKPPKCVLLRRNPQFSIDANIMD